MFGGQREDGDSLGPGLQSPRSRIVGGTEAVPGKRLY